MMSLKEYMNRKLRKRILTILISLIGIIFISYKVDFDIVRIFKGIPSMMNLFFRMLNPNFSYGSEVFEKIYETIEIAILSSLVGVTMAIPFALLTAENISPNLYLSKLL